jgi:hypothetical protein
MAGSLHYYVADRDGALRLPAAVVRLASARVRPAIELETGRSSHLFPDNGNFVVFRFEIRNTGSRPITYERVIRRPVLVSDGFRYFSGGPKAVEAELLGPWAPQRFRSIAPGHTVRAVAVFDLPDEALGWRRDAVLVFATPGRSGERTLGAIRLGDASA